MAGTLRVPTVDLERLDQDFFSPCEVCAGDPRTRSAVIRLGACPGACNHMRRVQQRLHRIRREHHQPGA